jgi:hypothetical protein
MGQVSYGIGTYLTRPNHLASIKTSKPNRLVRWMQKSKALFLTENPTIKHFKLHNLRGNLMSTMVEAGINMDQGSVAIRCGRPT